MVFKHTIYYLSKIIFIFSAVFCLSGCGKKPPLLPPVPPSEIEKNVTLNGRVAGYKTNPEGNIDKIIVNQGKQKSEIHFPPHLAKPILEIAKVNAYVHLKTSRRESENEMISISSEDGEKIFNAQDVLPPKPNPGREINITGNISGWVRTGKNDTTGFVIGNKTVMLNPEESRTLSPLLKRAKKVEITALERNAKDGTINTFRFPPVKMKNIKIDSIIYKIH